MSDWESAIAGFERSLKRLETARGYATDLDTESFQRWTAGGPACLPFVDDPEWVAMVRAKTSAGATIERVRVIDDPMTAYQTWLIPASAHIVAAGETHTYITRRVMSEVYGLNLDEHDFWLIDDEQVLLFGVDRYGDVAWTKLTSDTDTVDWARTRWSAVTSIGGAPGAE